MERQFKTIVHKLNHQELVVLVNTLLEAQEIREILVSRFSKKYKKRAALNRAVDYVNDNTRHQNLEDPF
ncbi:MAG TPA: hypothetical protein VKG26_08040 [Bacteroidia bacterium]|nr:hypothetical protein [Bacteroidia bacterium]